MAGCQSLITSLLIHQEGQVNQMLRNALFFLLVVTGIGFFTYTGSTESRGQNTATNSIENTRKAADSVDARNA